MRLEVWKDIDDYPNYQISSFGRVKSKEGYTRARNNQINLRKEGFQVGIVRDVGTKVQTNAFTRKASKELNISETSISNCINGNSKSAGGYIWLR